MDAKRYLVEFFFFLINKEQLHLHSKVCVSLRFNGYNECTSYSNKKKKTLSEHHFMTNKMWSHSEKQFQNNIRGQKKPPQSTFSHMQQSFLLWRRVLKEFQTPSLPVFFATHFLNSLCQCCLPEAVFIRVFWTIL